MQLLLVFIVVCYLLGLRAAKHGRLPLIPIIVLSFVAGASYYALRFI